MEDIVLLTIAVNAKTGQVIVLHNVSPESSSLLIHLAALMGALRVAGATLEKQVFGIAVNHQPNVQSETVPPYPAVDKQAELPFSES